MQIQKAKIEDTPRIARMGADFVRHLSKIDSYFSPASNSRKIFLDYFRKAIHSNNKLLLVAVEEGKIIGYALAKLSRKNPIEGMRRFGFIEVVYVEKRYRRSGVAGKFLEAIFSWFRSKRIKDMELYVLDKNEIGKRVWKKYGFLDYTMTMRKKI